jgi:hypothetical protein
MKWLLFYALPGACLLVIVLLPGCSKLREEIEQYPSDIGKYCKIQSFSETAPYVGGGVTHYNVSYNAAGNPLELVQADNLFQGLGLDLHFRYDKKGRLSDVLQTDPGMTFVYIWDRYSYPSSRVVIDSVFDYQGSVNDPSPPYDPEEQERIEVIKLDGEGRAINVYTYYTGPGIPASSYDLTYDRNGDQVIAGVTYDDKINIYQTSAVWQLHYLDYSRNNPVYPPPGSIGGTQTPAKYNSYGLPTQFLGPSVQLFYLPPFEEFDVTYSCDVSGAGTAD